MESILDRLRRTVGIVPCMVSILDKLRRHKRPLWQYLTGSGATTGIARVFVTVLILDKLRHYSRHCALSW